MKNLLQTHSIPSARGIKIALEAEGIPAVVLDEFDRGGLGGLWSPGRVRVAVLNDDDVFGAWGALVDEYGLGTLTYAVAAVVVIVFIGGSLLIVLGPRADKGNP